jgi:hypothetical protein
VKNTITSATSSGGRVGGYSRQTKAAIRQKPGPQATLVTQDRAIDDFSRQRSSINA